MSVCDQAHSEPYDADADADAGRRVRVVLTLETPIIPAFGGSRHGEGQGLTEIHRVTSKRKNIRSMRTLTC